MLNSHERVATTVSGVIPAASGQATSVTALALTPVSAGAPDPQHGAQHVLAQITGHRKPQHGAYCFSIAGTPSPACWHAESSCAWRSPVPACFSEWRAAGGPVDGM